MFDFLMNGRNRSNLVPIITVASFLLVFLGIKVSFHKIVSNIFKHFSLTKVEDISKNNQKVNLKTLNIDFIPLNFSFIFSSKDIFYRQPKNYRFSLQKFLTVQLPPKLSPPFVI